MSRSGVRVPSPGQAHSLIPGFPSSPPQTGESSRSSVRKCPPSRFWALASPSVVACYVEPDRAGQQENLIVGQPVAFATSGMLAAVTPWASHVSPRIAVSDRTELRPQPRLSADLMKVSMSWLVATNVTGRSTELPMHDPSSVVPGLSLASSSQVHLIPRFASAPTNAAPSFARSAAQSECPGAVDSAVDAAAGADEAKGVLADGEAVGALDPHAANGTRTRDEV